MVHRVLCNELQMKPAGPAGGGRATRAPYAHRVCVRYRVRRFLAGQAAWGTWNDASEGRLVSSCDGGTGCDEL